jgi:phage terminase large subunit-like protein
MVENRFVTTESSFVELEWWDACVDATAAPVVSNPSLPVWCGLDASTKRDSTAIVAVTWDVPTNKARLVFHRVFQPSPDEPLDFESTVERTVHELRRRFAVRGVWFDPYQMAAVAQRLQAAGAPMREFPQTVGNLTAMGSNLFELIKGRGLVAYADSALRLAISRAIAVETARGWRITKEKSAHKIDVVVALAMAAHAAVHLRWDEDVPIVAPLVISSDVRRWPVGF